LKLRKWLIVNKMHLNNKYRQKMLYDLFPNISSSKFPVVSFKINDVIIEAGNIDVFIIDDAL